MVVACLELGIVMNLDNILHYYPDKYKSLQW